MKIEKEIKGIKLNSKKLYYLSLQDNMIVHVENVKKSTRLFLELLNCLQVHLLQYQ